MNARLGLLALLATTGLCACAQQPRPYAFQPTERGIIIAQSKFVPGTTIATGLIPAPDCNGPGMGVHVQTTTGSVQDIYGPNAEPCVPSVTLFDGRFDKRAADPAVGITFLDALGPLTGAHPMGATPRADALPSLPPVPAIQVSSELLKDPLAQVEPAAGTPPTSTAQNTLTAPAQASDPLVSVLSSWQGQSTSRGAYVPDEASAAASRQLTRAVEGQNAARLQEQTTQLLASLREKERALQSEKIHNEQVQKLALESRAQTLAAQQAYSQEQSKLQSQLQATQSRLSELEALNAKLAADKARTQNTYQERIATLSSDLKSAQAQASRSRNELIREAAAKIAEAEQLANAARLSAAEANAREAARKKQEAEDMMARALDLANGKSVVLNDISAPTQPAPMLLMQVPVALHIKDATPAQILEEVLKQAKPQAGEWKPDWQLPSAQSYILSEKWSLTAEAPVQQVLAQLTAQIKAAHGLTLQFTQFPQSKLLVVTTQ